MTTKTRPSVAETRIVARSIVSYINSGRQWTVADLRIPADLYDVDRLDESDFHPVTIASITATLRSVAR